MSDENKVRLPNNPVMLAMLEIARIKIAKVIADIEGEPMENIAEQVEAALAKNGITIVTEEQLNAFGLNGVLRPRTLQ